MIFSKFSSFIVLSVLLTLHLCACADSTHHRGADGVVCGARVDGAVARWHLTWPIWLACAA